MQCECGRTSFVKTQWKNPYNVRNFFKNSEAARQRCFEVSNSFDVLELSPEGSNHVILKKKNRYYGSLVEWEDWNKITTEEIWNRSLVLPFLEKFVDIQCFFCGKITEKVLNPEIRRYERKILPPLKSVKLLGKFHVEVAKLPGQLYCLDKTVNSYADVLEAAKLPANPAALKYVDCRSERTFKHEISLCSIYSERYPFSILTWNKNFIDWWLYLSPHWTFPSSNDEYTKRKRSFYDDNDEDDDDDNKIREKKEEEYVRWKDLWEIYHQNSGRINSKKKEEWKRRNDILPLGSVFYKKWRNIECLRCGKIYQKIRNPLIDQTAYVNKNIDKGGGDDKGDDNDDDDYKNNDNNRNKIEYVNLTKSDIRKINNSWGPLEFDPKFVI